MREEERIATASVCTGLAMTEERSRKERTPEMIGAEIRMYADAGRRITLLCGIEIGRRLVEAKELLAHGEWLPWLRRETEFSERSAQNYMKVFNSYGAEQQGLFGPETNTQTFADLPISKALAMLSLPESEREDFAAEVDAESLSVRELEEKVRERTEALEREREEMQKAHAVELHDAEEALEEAQDAREKAEEQLRRIRAELDEIEKRPQTVAYERDEEAIARAANEAADAERAKHAQAEKELKEKIAALEEEAKKNEMILRAAQEDIKKAAADADSAKAAAEKAKKAEADNDALRGEIDGLKKQLSLAAPEVAAFKAAFDRAQDELVHMNDALHKIQDTEIRDKLRKASLAMLAGFQERVEE